ncbi:ppGpp synthetase/RelA/SpoT-type nucleotidyltransferase [Inhella inkyongensis]|uniref:PpGpp synthetase/RelA/SpoT-type nucleotidyltransferase n=1 Tax=Inhella inkyongensis TaxID=392593 RepID=A0A840S3U9_9BURK|nr:hypothetical protein [Inhella inkyongensis]MBB5205035.1 ppGpp synthetase/RelA/SpoT-type nucleotidyltransferase [Inhella inkyongensis]
MLENLTLNDFLERNRLSQESWEKSCLSWDALLAIASDHEANRNKLTDTAELFARTLQRCQAVHSVRFRVKDSEHLLEKLVRKAAEGSSKYLNVSEKNYFEVVTDLIGVRALHLFKDECFGIHQVVRDTWALHEDPTAFIREGDPKDLLDRFSSLGLQVRQHPAGYRSVHYVCATQPLQRRVLVEIQVRTIFEEGWSEVDHRVRYPNFSEDPLVAYFLIIFNRLAGSADEMGSFVQQLTSALSNRNLEIEEARQEKDVALRKMTDALDALSAIQEKDQQSNQLIENLKAQVKALGRLSPDLTDPAAVGTAMLRALNPRLTSAAIQRSAARDIARSISQPSMAELMERYRRDQMLGGSRGADSEE